MDSAKCKWNSQNVSGIRNFKWNPQTKSGSHLQFANSIPLTICGFRLQLRFLQQLNVTLPMSYYLFVDFTNCSGFRLFLSSFERYKVSCISLWNPKQQRRSKKSRFVADSATNLILARFGIQSQGTECTVLPQNAGMAISCYKVCSKSPNLLKLRINVNFGIIIVLFVSFVPCVFLKSFSNLKKKSNYSFVGFFTYYVCKKTAISN